VRLLICNETLQCIILQRENYLVRVFSKRCLVHHRLGLLSHRAALQTNAGQTPRCVATLEVKIHSGGNLTRRTAGPALPVILMTIGADVLRVRTKSDEGAAGREPSSVQMNALHSFFSTIHAHLHSTHEHAVIAPARIGV